jgi:hypothetical protein
VEKQRTTLWLDDRDRAAIAAIRERFGCGSATDAVRLALRLLAESERVQIVPSPSTKRDHHD